MPFAFAAAELTFDAVTITCCYLVDPVAAVATATPPSEFAVCFLVSTGTVAVAFAGKAEEDGPVRLLGFGLFSAEASY